MKEATASELPAAPHTDRLLSLFDDKLHGALVLYLYASILSAGRLLSGKLDCLLQGFPLAPVLTLTKSIKRIQKACSLKPLKQNADSSQEGQFCNRLAALITCQR